MYLYILQNCIDNQKYIGITRNLEQRLKEHNKGKVRTTKLKKPWEIIYSEVHDSMAKAREREKYLKSYKGVADKRKILATL